jgi:hypothetical protein
MHPWLVGLVWSGLCSCCRVLVRSVVVFLQCCWGGSECAGAVLVLLSQLCVHPQYTHVSWWPQPSSLSLGALAFVLLFLSLVPHGRRALTFVAVCTLAWSVQTPSRRVALAGCWFIAFLLLNQCSAVLLFGFVPSVRLLCWCCCLICTYTRSIRMCPWWLHPSGASGFVLLFLFSCSPWSARL